MNNSDVIKRLCIGTKDQEYSALSSSEFSKLLELFAKRQDSVFSLEKFVLTSGIIKTHFKIDRLLFLLSDRENHIEYLNTLSDRGVKIITVADTAYPGRIRSKLGISSPPLFYSYGNMSILERKAIGFAGSRCISTEDIEFGEFVTKKFMSEGYGIVSGGAKGSDRLAALTCLQNNGYVVEFIPSDLAYRKDDPEIKEFFNSGKLLMLSSTDPFSKFSVQAAMERNKFIYCHAQKMVIVRFEEGHGGTWSGLVENFRHNFCDKVILNSMVYKSDYLDAHGAIGLQT